jgi:MFS family permease
LRCSIREAAAYSVMTGGLETYFSAFALFLRASASQVALLATLPNLLGSLAQLGSAWLGHRIQRRKPIIVAGAYLQALVLPFMFLLPLAFPNYAIVLLMLALTLYHAAAHIIVPQWMSLMGELVPERKRGRFFAHRTRISTICSFAALAAGGITLHVLDVEGSTKLGFAALFVVAFLARLYSVRNLKRMHEPREHAASLEVLTDFSWLKKPEFAAAKRFSLFFILMQSAVGISAPFFSVYMLKTLEFSYFHFMLNTGTAVLMQFLTLSYWGRISDIMGNRLVLVTTGTIIPTLPALWLVSPDVWYLLCLQVLSGFAWAGFSLSAGNILYELVPREKRATYQALQGVLLTIGVFCGGMLGSVIVHFMPRVLQIGGWQHTLTTTLLWAFLTSSMIRACISLVFLPRLRELRKPRRQLTPYELVFRFTRFNAFMGLVYEVVTKIRKQKTDSK